MKQKKKETIKNKNSTGLSETTFSSNEIASEAGAVRRTKDPNEGKARTLA